MSDLNTLFAKVRSDFPALQQQVHNKPLVYLDSAASSLKPKQVVNRISEFYLNESSNVHRGAHTLSDRATHNFEQARAKVAQFINAPMAEEIVFVRGTTEAINLVAHSFAATNLKAGDVILISEMEHHANIVPWQMVAEKIGANVIAVKVTDDGELDFTDLKNKLNSSVKLVAITGCSNTLGTIVDIKSVTKLAHSVGAKVLVDAAQLVTNSKIDVQDIDCDFLAFSAHKIFGPFGFGVLYGKMNLLEKMPPYQGGGSMISQVSFSKTTFNDVPFKFEAGTPHVEGAVGLHAALDYVDAIGLHNIHAWESSLLDKAMSELIKIPNVQIIGRAQNKGAIISFNINGAHHSDVGQIMDQMGVAVRAGHHCTQPLMQRMGITGSVRASFSIYNNFEDVEKFIQAVSKARELLT